jgi:hypothetical protein
MESKFFKPEWTIGVLEIRASMVNNLRQTRIILAFFIARAESRLRTFGLAIVGGEANGLDHWFAKQRGRFPVIWPVSILAIRRHPPP